MQSLHPLARGLVTAALTFGSLFTALAPGFAHAVDGKVTVQWFGQSAFKITTLGGKVILIDPYLTKNPKTPAEHKDLAALGKVDLILVTHAHGDHVGDGPALAKQHKAPLYGPAGLNDTLVALGELPSELAPRFNKGGVIQPLGEGIRVTMTRAEHSSEYRWTNPQTASPRAS
jgi:L-ascorbate metabolism protein UlaG (beta-lactamase superfamily)